MSNSNGHEHAGAEYWSLPENSYLMLSSPKILKFHPNMPKIVVHNFASQPLGYIRL